MEVDNTLDEAERAGLLEPGLGGTARGCDHRAPALADQIAREIDRAASAPPSSSCGRT